MKINGELKEINLAVIIPTYKETENLVILIERILINFSCAKIFVVDDSPLEENIEVRRLLKKYKKKIQIISRFKKGGRGSAVLTGLKVASKDKTINFFFEMDADLGHSPEEITHFFAKRQAADIIIGSRYLTGSNISTWSKRRIFLSKIINGFLNVWLDLSLSDYTNGFRMYNRRAVEFLISIKLKEKGFIALSETAYKLRRAGFIIAEVPISFTDRKHGKSNAGLKEHFSALIGAFRIRFS